jgi:hypothetical protein
MLFVGNKLLFFEIVDMHESNTYRMFSAKVQSSIFLGGTHVSEIPWIVETRTTRLFMDESLASRASKTNSFSELSNTFPTPFLLRKDSDMTSRWTMNATQHVQNDRTDQDIVNGYDMAIASRVMHQMVQQCKKGQRGEEQDYAMRPYCGQ